MPATRVRSFLLVPLAALVAACGGCGGNAKLMEVQRVKAGDLEVVLLSSDGALHQKGAFALEFRSAADAKPVNAGSVRASASMPMPGMPPMFGTIDVGPADASGRYPVQSKFEMSGGWRIALEWDGPAGRSAANFTGTVQ